MNNRTTLTAIAAILTIGTMQAEKRPEQQLPQTDSATETLLKRPMTLKDCIDMALERNIGLKQRENMRRQQELNLSTARNSRLPDLNASVGQNFSFGRGLTSENTYTNTNTSSTSFSIGTSVPLFTGMNITNTIKLNRLNLEAATAELESARNDIRAQVAQAYVELIYAHHIAHVAHSQVSIDSMQTARLQTMLDNGKTSPAELAQQQATLAQSLYTQTQADNNVELAMLALMQLLEMQPGERPDITWRIYDDFEPEAIPSADVVYAEATGVRPEVLTEQLRLKATERSIAIARSALYPQLSLSAGLGSNYYKTSGYTTETFANQLKNNFSQYIGLNLSIPIFNRFQTCNSIRSAKLDRETQQLQLENTRKTLYKEIQQTYHNATAAAAKYESSTRAAESSRAALQLMTAKYENGKATITEFNEAKNNSMKAESDMVQAKYEYIYQTALLNFYRGKDIGF